MNIKATILTILAMVFGSAHAQSTPPIIKISALASGKLLLNGNPVEIDSIETEFKTLKERNGVVWYYRENGQGEPPKSAMDVIRLIVKYKLPISMSSKPDFSDSIDGNGNSTPRKP